MSDPLSSMFSNLHNVQFTGGQYHQQIIYGQPIERSIDKLYRASAPSAVHTYEHGGLDQPKCHQGTREAIFKRLWDWLLGHVEHEALMMWLYGAAGAGKSAIAYDLAEMCSTKGLLLGDFFFSKSDSSRAHIRSFVATLAIQAIHSYPLMRSDIERVVCEDPRIFDLRFEHQLERLIIRPLRRIAALSNKHSPRLIIVDGLDECHDYPVQQRIITALLSFSQEMNHQGFPIRVLIASRPDHHLIATLNSVTPSNILSRIPLSNNHQSSYDIERFIVDKLQEVKNTYPSFPSSWPGHDAIGTLVQKASGQFIYAKLAISFITDGRLGPLRALDIVLGLQVSPGSQCMPFAELDAMYHCILSQYGDIQMAKLILGVRLITAQKLSSDVSKWVKELMGGWWEWTLTGGLKSTQALAIFLNIERTEVSFFVKRLSAVVEESDRGTLIIHHASLVDFIQDPSRSGPYYVDCGQHHAQLSVLYLRRFITAIPAVESSGRLTELELFLTLAAPLAELQRELCSFFNLVFKLKSESQSFAFWEMVPPIFVISQGILSPEDYCDLRTTFDCFLDDGLAPITSWPTDKCAYLICLFDLGKFTGNLDILPQIEGGICMVLSEFKHYSGQAYIVDFLSNRSKLKLPPPSPYLFTSASGLLLKILTEDQVSPVVVQYIRVTGFNDLISLIERSIPSNALAKKINPLVLSYSISTRFPTHVPDIKTSRIFVDYLLRSNVEPLGMLYKYCGYADGIDYRRNLQPDELNKGAGYDPAMQTMKISEHSPQSREDPRFRSSRPS